MGKGSNFSGLVILLTPIKLGVFSKIADNSSVPGGTATSRIIFQPITRGFCALSLAKKSA